MLLTQQFYLSASPRARAEVLEHRSFHPPLKPSFWKINSQELITFKINSKLKHKKKANTPAAHTISSLLPPLHKSKPKMSSLFSPFVLRDEQSWNPVHSRTTRWHWVTITKWLDHVSHSLLSDVGTLTYKQVVLYGLLWKKKKKKGIAECSLAAWALHKSCVILCNFRESRLEKLFKTWMSRSSYSAIQGHQFFCGDMGSEGMQWGGLCFILRSHNTIFSISPKTWNRDEQAGQTERPSEVKLASEEQGFVWQE